MADIFQEVEEDLRRDRYERLARKYGGYVIGGVVLVVVATAGYVWWKDYHQRQQQSATLQLAQAIDQAAAPVQAPPAASAAATSAATPPAANDANAAPKTDDVSAALKKLAAEGPSGPAGLARFYEGGVRVRAGDRAGAVALYDSLAKDPSISALYRDLATLLAVQLSVNDGDPKGLGERLGPLTADASPWHYTARELSALLAARTGDTVRAKTLFQQLADDTGAPAGLRARAAELAAFYGRI